MKLFCSSGALWKLFLGTRKTTKMSIFWQEPLFILWQTSLFFPSPHKQWAHRTEAAIKVIFSSFYNPCTFLASFSHQHTKHKEGLQLWVHQRCAWWASNPAPSVGQWQPSAWGTACSPFCPGSCHASTDATQHFGPAGRSLPQANWSIQASETTVIPTGVWIGVEIQKSPCIKKHSLTVAFSAEIDFQSTKEECTASVIGQCFLAACF